MKQKFKSNNDDKEAKPQQFLDHKDLTDEPDVMTPAILLTQK